MAHYMHIYTTIKIRLYHYFMLYISPRAFTIILSKIILLFYYIYIRYTFSQHHYPIIGFKTHPCHLMIYHPALTITTLFITSIYQPAYSLSTVITGAHFHMHHHLCFPWTDNWSNTKPSTPYLSLQTLPQKQQFPHWFPVIPPMAMISVAVDDNTMLYRF